MNSYPYSWIDSDRALTDCCQSLLSANAIAVDTEFMRSTTFFPKAALIQMSDGQHHYLVDPLAISQFDVLVSLFNNTAVIKVFHSCSEDLEVIHYFLHCVPQPIVDTQIAAALVNMGSAVGYGNLVKQLINRELDKGETRSDWLQRPLEAKQITYAVQDVAYLLPVYDMLMTQLQNLGRQHWLWEDCQRLVTAAKHPINLDDYYLKVKSAWRLSEQQLAVLKSLCSWREKKSRILDVPRNHIVPEKVLLDIAIKQAEGPLNMARIEGLYRKQRRQFGDEVLEVVAAAQALPISEYPPRLPRPLSSAQKKLLKALKPLAEDIATRENLPVEVLVKKQELEQLVRSTATEPVLPERLQGWRKQVVGDPLLDLVLHWQKGAEQEAN